MYASQQVEAMQSFASSLSMSLRQLQEHCNRVYPHHQQPIPCLKPAKSFILQGGADPLDFIYVYKNEGQPERNISRHWHYIGLGLSDIHGYSIFCRHHEALRLQSPEYAKSTPPMTDIYPPPFGPRPVSGFGFELTMRVKCNSDTEWQSDPPGWPGKIMQDLARYVFKHRNIFHVGDHVADLGPLDSSENGADSSRIKHVLMTLDPQLTEVETGFGCVKFIQIVGACTDELWAAREWNVRGVLEMMRDREETGGPFLVTDMRRGETIFDLDPDKHARWKREVQRSGSDTAQISARHKTSHVLPSWFTRASEDLNQQQHSSDEEQQQQRPVLRPSGGDHNELASVEQEDRERPARPASRMSVASESGLYIENFEHSDTRYYNSVYLLLSYESARLLPVMLNGRLAHRRPFSFQSCRGDSLVTFIPEGLKMNSMVETPGKPFARKGPWLQIFVPDELLRQMKETVMCDFGSDRDRSQSRQNDYPDDEGQEELGEADGPSRLSLPRNYSWPEYNLHLTIVDEIADD